MSWDDHIKGKFLMGSGIMSKAAIASQQCGSTVASSMENGIQNIKLKPDEVFALVKACKGDESCLDNGIYLEGNKYIVVNRCDNQVNLKATKSVNDVKHSVSAITTNQLVIIGIDKDGSNKGSLANQVFLCAQYLTGSGC